MKNSLIPKHKITLLLACCFSLIYRMYNPEDKPHVFNKVSTSCLNDMPHWKTKITKRNTMVKRADGQCNTVTTKYFTEKTRKVGKYIKTLEIVYKKIKKTEFKFHRRTLSPKRPRRYGRLFIEYLNRAMLR